MSMTAQPNPQVLESKLRHPWVRPGIVSRGALVDRLLATDAVPVVSVVAPAGYGKTTFLAQWAESKEPRVGWVASTTVTTTPSSSSLHRGGTGPRRGDRPESVSCALVGRHRNRGCAAAGRRDAGMRQPVALVIDNFEVVTNPESRMRSPRWRWDCRWVRSLRSVRGSVAVTDRASTRAGRHRGGRDRRSGDGRVEAGPLLLQARASSSPTRTSMSSFDRTEGWPVGLYLAALAVNAGGSPTVAQTALTGDDRYIGDYLRSELLIGFRPRRGVAS